MSKRVPERKGINRICPSASFWRDSLTRISRSRLKTIIIGKMIDVIEIMDFK